MNSENLDYLQNRLKYLGFGEEGPLNQELEENVLLGQPEFQLFTDAVYEDCRMEATLHFSRSGERDTYYFKSYDARLLYAGSIEADKAQTFYIYKKWGFTFKEAFNLLEGRAVYKKRVSPKDDTEYWAWSQLNFGEKTPSGNYKYTEYKDSSGYDLEKVLHLYPIIELQDEQLKMALIRSLQRGNIHPVHFVKNHKKEKVFIEANPKTKLINISPLATRAATRAEELPKEGEPVLLTLQPATHQPVAEPEPSVVEEPGIPPSEPEATEATEATEPPHPSPRRPQRKRIYK
ncbi:hypothetical protein ACQ86N_21215 [Puia sp. P3]|uniref:hypothetical protein n=1 Tax=Puia sp. P3 TaxID=3423952 RepID=UPI003D66D47F